MEVIFLAGKIKNMIEKIVTERSHGNGVIAGTVIAKLCLKGVIVKKYNEESEDDPAIIAKLENIAKEFEVKL